MSHLLLFSVLAVLAGATPYQKIIALQRERLNAVFGACFRRTPAVNTLRHLSWHSAVTILKPRSVAMPAT
jgi:hypothetical protein